MSGTLHRVTATPAGAARARPWALGAVLLLQAALVLVLTRWIGLAHNALWLYCLTVPLFLIAIRLFARLELPPRRALLLLLGVGAVLQVLALTHATTTSDDDNRYIWDAKVQLSGVDPYRYAPQAPQLQQLRDPFLFPGGDCPHPIPGSCTTINRPSVHTIYPPVAEGSFVAIRLASFGGHGGHLPIQIAGALGVIAISVLLARHALARRRPLWMVALWAWCPMPILEFSNAGHVDWLATLFVVLGLGLAAQRRDAWAGGLIGAAIATKLYPAIVLFALLRRRPGVLVAAAIGLVALSYLPHVLAVGSAVIGYLPGYLHEENYASGSRLLLLGSVLPHPADTVVGALILAGVAWLVWRRTNPDMPERGAVVLMGTTLLVATPVYGWYAGVLLALVVMSGAIEWLPVALAPTLAYLIRLDLTHNALASRAVYGVAALLTLVLWRRLQGAPHQIPVSSREHGRRDDVTTLAAAAPRDKDDS